MAEDLFEGFYLNKRCNPKHAFTIKTAVRTENVEMRIEANEIAKGLDGNDSPRDCILLRDNGMEKHFQRGPCTSAQFREESSVYPVKSLKGAAKLHFTGSIEVIPPQDFGYAEDEVTVGNGLNNGTGLKANLVYELVIGMICLLSQMVIFPLSNFPDARPRMISSCPSIDPSISNPIDCHAALRWHTLLIE